MIDNFFLETEYIPFDIRAEIFVALFHLSYPDLEEEDIFYLHRKKLKLRPKSSTIHKAEQPQQESEVAEEEKVHSPVLQKDFPERDVIKFTPPEQEEEQAYGRLSVLRDGLIRTLPEMMYLREMEDGAGTSALSDREKARKYAEQIEDTIRFFSPFDQVLFEPGVELAKKELKLPSQIVDSLLEFPEWTKYIEAAAEAGAKAEEEADQDPIQEESEAERENRLARRERQLSEHLITTLKLGILIASRISGDFIQTAAFFSEVLGQKVHIRQEMDVIYPIPAEQQFRLGHADLGRGSILGTHFLDGIPSVLIEIQELDDHLISSYLDGGAYRILLEKVLYPHFLPLEAHSKTRILATPREFHLGEQDVRSYLGVTTFLCNGHQHDSQHCTCHPGTDWSHRLFCMEKGGNQ